MTGYVLKSNYSVGSITSGLSNKISTSVERVAGAKNTTSSYTGLRETIPSERIEKERSSQISTENSPIQFPSDLGTDYYISFNAFKNSEERPTESRRFTFNKSINLPLPANMTDSYSSAYKSEDLFFLGNAAKEAASTLFKEGGGVVGGLEKLGDASYLGSKAKEALNSISKPGAALGLAATGSVFALSGVGGPLASAAKSSLQLTTNPFPVMIFQGTSFKPAFTFDWTLYPESYEEAVTIKKIIGFFRREMLPEAHQDNRSILKTPSIFEITVTPSHALRKFKRCVLTNMGINYAPTGVSFVTDSEQTTLTAPTATSISLTFQEIEVWLADDYSVFESFNFDPIN